jgi:hypothetical protein
MARKKLGIGAQSMLFFQKENAIYVDKTQKIHELMQIGIYNFIVRPRRFGKSLLLSTLYNIYRGEKELLEQTWIYDKIDWEKVKRPTLRLDFTLIAYKETPLEQSLRHYLHSIAQDEGIETANTWSSKEIFKELIEKLAKEKPIVILIDEYEMPVTDFVGKDEARMNENIDTLKSLYGTMKGMSEYIHRAYITGVTKIGRVGILSDLNMLNDLTLDARFTTLFGYTEKELRHYYAEYITEAAEKYECTEAEILVQIKHQYNGYSWDGIEENKVYNPFSIVNFFQGFQFQNYWFETGTPTVLVRGARKNQLTMEEMEHIKASADLLKSANLTTFYSISLLFQAGYLTIKKVERRGWEMVYHLGFPNHEVRNSFASYLLAEYVQKDWQEMEYTIAYRLKNHLEDEELREAFQIFVPVITSTGYDITKHTEGYFHTIMHVLMYSTGLEVYSELQNAQGRLDTICIGQNAIYVFEFKINSTAASALTQIKAQNYAQPFISRGKPLYIVGVNFVTADKKINEILVEKWNGTQFERLEGDFTPKF